MNEDVPAPPEPAVGPRIKEIFEKKMNSGVTHFDVRDQFGYGSDDFPESVVHSLKEMATVAKVNLEGNGWSHVGTQDPSSGRPQPKASKEAESKSTDKKDDK